MREKELRLALICYGGISLAVYMHGITKEIWHLARASRSFHDGADPASASERGYAELLRTIEATCDLKLRVLTDIIAGASAGGINGIFLSQAIATGQPLEPLTGLWLEKADIEELLDPEARQPSRFSKLWATPIVWAFARRQGEVAEADVEPEARDEVHEKLVRFVRSRWFEPPFGGAVFTRLLLDAFDAMETLPAGPRLLPDAQPLDLFVTVTDFHGHHETLRLNSPPEIAETEHRLTFGFRDAPGEPNWLGDPADLTFAARATASFPGAFPPFTAAELDGVLGERRRLWPGRNDFLARVLPQRAATGLADKAVLIDGSTLANAPFRPAIDALRSRPARREIDRRFVYIDPKPGIHSVKVMRGEAAIPGFFNTILSALADLPREQPIRDNLEAIEARSARIRRMRRIVEKLRPLVEQSVADLFGHTMFLDRPTTKRVTAWRERAEERAARDAGHSYAGYCHLKTAAIIESAPADQRDLLWAEADAGTPETFFARYDIAYRVRRLRFLARRLAALEENEGGKAYEVLRQATYRSLAEFIELESDPHLPRDLPALDLVTDAAIAEALGAAPKAERRAALLAYLGFPFYDVATLALLQGEGLDEFDAIKVDRISPEDAQAIREGPPGATLKGIQFNSFGAFFSRAYRENDYLWGRLHGAERLIDIIISTLPPARCLPADDVAALKYALFDTILDEEALRLNAIPATIATVRAEVAARRQSRAGGKSAQGGLG